MLVNKTYLAVDFKNPTPLESLPDLAGNFSSISVKYNSISSAELPIVKAYVDNRLQKIRNHFDELLVATIFLFIDATASRALRHTVEITIHLKNHQLYSEAQGEDLYSTIDSVIEKISKSISHLL